MILAGFIGYTIGLLMGVGIMCLVQVGRRK